jgi:ferrochelatase
MSSPTGVLLMSYGTPRSPDDVEAFYTDVRRGRPPSPEQLSDLRRRYEAIGGTSPLTARTTAQADALQAALGPLSRYRVISGTKHSHPSIEEAVAQLSGEGVERAVGLVLAPHYSVLSVGEYVARAKEAVDRNSMSARFVESWHLAEGLLDALAVRVREALDSLGPAARGSTEVIFSAHSLPCRILDSGDPYPEQLRETAEEVAKRAGAPRWRVAWQSAGRTPEPWLGPDLTEVLRAVRADGAFAAVVCPAGFVSDHLEVLYDIDIQARACAESLGLRMVRTRSLNDDPRLISALASLVREAEGGLG